MTRSTERWARADTPPVLINPSAPPKRTNWGILRPGVRVMVRTARELPYEAVVDVLTQDATVVWVVPAQIGIRRAFHISDDVDITEILP